MKDGWRPDLQGVTKEWDILIDLQDKPLPHIPRILFGGDIPEKYHRTLADKYVNSEWRVGPKTKLTQRVHYRFTEDAGKPLEESVNAKESTQVLADVIEVLQAAWVRCRYLYRDVNIVVTPGGRGVLIDWEFAKKVPPEVGELEIYLGVPGRAGTWYYMSAVLLRFPEVRHSHLDDLQSVSWVASEVALNYLNQRGGIYKTAYLQGADFIDFVGNPAFFKPHPRTLSNDSYTDLWRVAKLTGDDKFIELVPDHDTVLREALGCPEDDWSPERHRMSGAFEKRAPWASTLERYRANQPCCSSRYK